MAGSVILSGARTPIGKLSGALAGFEATDLGAVAIRAALQRAGLSPEQVDYVFMGQVLLGGAGQMTARQAATKAGIPLSAPARPRLSRRWPRAATFLRSCPLAVANPCVSNCLP